jgi:hypothetical protein
LSEKQLFALGTRGERQEAVERLQTGNQLQQFNVFLYFSEASRRHAGLKPSRHGSQYRYP